MISMINSEDILLFQIVIEIIITGGRELGGRIITLHPSIQQILSRPQFIFFHNILLK